MADEPAPPDRQNLVDDHRALFIQGLALTLFDHTRLLHNLSDQSRHVLSMAALFCHGWPSYDPQQSFANPNDLIWLDALEKPTNAVIETLTHVLAIYHHHVRVKDLQQCSFPPEYLREIRTLTALLKIAENLDSSRSQTTHIQRIEPVEGGLWLVIQGPNATDDAARANKAARMWQRIGYPKIRILDEATATAELLPYPVPVDSPGITPQDSLADAGRKVMLAQFAELLRHEEGVRLGEDIEELHDMRVATRRLRAAFEVYKEAFPQKTMKPHLARLRTLGRALGQARDLDVLLEKAHAYQSSLPLDHQNDLQPLIQHWEDQRQAAQVALLAHFDSKSYQKFKHRFNLFVQAAGPGTNRKTKTSVKSRRVSEIAPVLIYERLAAVKTYEQLFRESHDITQVPVERLHALRIEYKQLRYTVEYFREILRVECKPVINDLKFMQDHLGDLHDAYVAIDLLQQFLDQAAPTDQNRLHGVVAYREYRRDEFEHLREATPGAWEYFSRPEFKLNLSLALSVL